MSSTDSMIPAAGLNFLQPIEFVTALAFFSPVILATSLTSLSFLFQNFKGLIYLAFLLGACMLRSTVYMYNTGGKPSDDGPVGEGCNMIQYSKFGNATFSSFVFAFTFMYLFVPMFASQNINYWIFSAFMVSFALDSFIKYYKQCVPQAGDLVLNILAGMALSALIISMMYAGGSGQFLFFNEVSDGKQVCYQPKNQTFKCAVYKNGELMGSI